MISKLKKLAFCSTMSNGKQAKDTTFEKNFYYQSSWWYVMLLVFGVPYNLYSSVIFFKNDLVLTQLVSHFVNFVNKSAVTNTLGGTQKFFECDELTAHIDKSVALTFLIFFTVLGMIAWILWSIVIRVTKCSNNNAQGQTTLINRLAHFLPLIIVIFCFGAHIVLMALIAIGAPDSFLEINKCLNSGIGKLCVDNAVACKEGLSIITEPFQCTRFLHNDEECNYDPFEIVGWNGAERNQACCADRVKDLLLWPNSHFYFVVVADVLILFDGLIKLFKFVSRNREVEPNICELKTLENPPI